MTLTERRALITTHSNPNKALDYVITLKGGDQSRGIVVSFRYIPDKVILDHAAFTSYLHAIFNDCTSLEEAGTWILEDMNNELVARWLQVNLTQHKDEMSEHLVVLEDHQPQWNNTHLKDRFARI
ncbi:hypothetical protein [Terasakiella pusilla]|uniref:hypothetical protein n=1 Tax=Terasakiella pusilla TaxID=64973 RepID=UPI003AA82AA3